MQPHFVHSSSFLFDLGLKQSIHFYWLFSKRLLASILDRTRSEKGFLLNIIFKHYKMINLESITNKNKKKHNEKWPYIPDHSCRILIIGGSGSEKTNTLISLIKEQDYKDAIDKIYLYAKDLNEPKYQFLLE